jgi:hypothetical protein
MEVRIIDFNLVVESDIWNLCKTVLFDNADIRFWVNRFELFD